MKSTLKKLFLGCTVALGSLAASAQGLEGIIVEEYHTITAADATLINNNGTQTDPIPVGAKVYRVYVDMLPNYRFLSVTGGSTAQGIPLNFSTTTSFWNNDVLADQFSTQTRFLLQNGNAFDSYLTIHTTSKAGGSAPSCAAFGGGSSSNTQQVGVLRSADPNGNLTLCNAFSGFTANDGNLLVPFTITPSLSGFFTTTNFDAFTAAANTFTMVEDGFSLLPAVTGVDPAGTNRVLIGQFTTDGVFSFNINVALQSPSQVDEFYVYANPLASEQLSTALTYPSAACNAPVLSTPTSNGPLCAGQTLNLTSSATGDATITYSWAGPNGFTSTQQNPSIAGATALATGTYTVTAANGCAPDASATVSATVNAPANAGTNGTLTICAGTTVTGAQLFAQLGGTPNAGGAWSPALAGAGTYTYTVTGVAPCANATAQVVVTAQPAPNAGTNGTLLICAGSTVTAAQLFAQLGGTPNAGGVWSPALAGAGSYTYTVAAVAPCTGSATAQVVVTQQAAPSAGTNGALSICPGTTVTAAQLFDALNGTPNAGGVWTPTLAGVGTYTYTVNAVAPCTGTATAQVTVTEDGAPNAGTNGALTICAGSTVTTAQLFDALNGTPNAGGVWTPALAGAGTYTYTVTAVAPCTGTATAQVVVTAQPAANAGTNGSLTICAGSTVSAAQLFAALSGTPNAGGVWSPALAGAGTYTYTVAAVAPCTVDATAQVVVTEQASPNAGTNGTLSICSTASAQNLFAQLGGTPDGGGVWTGPSPVVGGLYDPSTMTPGVYTYAVAATAPCTGAATATVTVTETATGTWYQDSDADGAGDPNVVLDQCDQPVGYVANNNDLCPADGNKIAPGACGCGVADVAATYYADVDGDGFGDPASPVAGLTCVLPAGAVSNNTDNCPILFGRQGDACDDTNASTNNDVITPACVCAGTPVGANDCLGVPNGPAQPGTPCDDGLTTTGNDTWSASCQCVGQPFDCLNVAGGTALPGTSCDDGLATTGNDIWSGSCVCAGQVIDCLGVIGGTALPGTSCNDNNGLTTNDVYLANCTCQGTPIGGCTEIVSIEFDTDAAPAQTSWEIIPEGGGAVVCAGVGSYAANTTITETCCLAQGCYALRVLDSAGDGITNGGYVLTEQATSKRIIDNRDNFSTGSVSAISGVQGFCLPLGTDRLISSSCDKLSWLIGQYLVATENTTVSSQWVPNGVNAVQPANSGYEFWIFDPNGSYSFRRFRSHNVSDGRSPANAVRACHMKINGWVNTVSTPHIPANVLMNIRVRGRVNGTNQVFGPACRFKVDPARAACPLTKLLSSTGSTNSCGVTRNFGNGNFLYAQPPQFNPAVAASLLRYQFRFRSAGFEVIRQSNTYILPLNWTGATALQCDVTYSVDVRVSKDGGATWCIDTPTPSAQFTPWGDACNVTITPCASGLALATSTSGEGTLTMYPNPNRGDQLFISLTEVAADVRTASVDIFDMTGKRIATRTITVQDGFVNQSVELNGELAGGLYMVNVTAGAKTYTERLLIQP